MNQTSTNITGLQLKLFNVHNSVSQQYICKVLRCTYVCPLKRAQRSSALEKYLNSVEVAFRELAQVPCLLHSCSLKQKKNYTEEMAYLGLRTLLEINRTTWPSVVHTLRFLCSTYQKLVVEVSEYILGHRIFKCGNSG